MQLRNAAGKFDHLEAANNFAARVRVDLAMLAGDDGGELVEIALEQFLELEHDARAF